MSVIYFSPVYRPALRSIGAPNLLRSSPLRKYPAYDVEKRGEHAYRITLAVPGFRLDDLAITARSNELIVTGKHLQNVRGQHLRHGFVSEGFECRFELDDHVEITDASLSNGLLAIELEQRLPKAIKPRTVRINGKGSKSKLFGSWRPAVASAFDAVAGWFARGRASRSSL